MRVTSFLSVAAALIVCGVGGVGASATAASSCSVSSPPHRVALVELYTSEGCSSCPPAENWLSALDQERTASTIVPLALHVDYWDSLGWKDRFAQSTFTIRQQRLSAEGRQHTVYTPEVFVDGRELRAWSDDARFVSAIHQLNAEASQIDIHVEAHPMQSGRIMFKATFLAAGELPDDIVAYAAVYESGIDSNVKAGENEGATLHHDRVVRQWIGPVPVIDGHVAITGDYPGGSGKSGVVAFAENRATGEVLQVSELPSCAN
jgi:hypothetical protein